MEKDMFEHDNIATTFALAAKYRHANRTKGIFLQGNLLTLFCALYVDDGAFPFKDRSQLELGLSLIYNHFVKFGLKMHIGQGSKYPNTECIFSCRLFLNQNKIVSCEINGENKLCIRRSKHVKGDSHENKCKR